MNEICYVNHQHLCFLGSRFLKGTMLKVFNSQSEHCQLNSTEVTPASLDLFQASS